MEELWGGFRARFLALWAEHSHKGDAYDAALFHGNSEEVRGRWLAEGAGWEVPCSMSQACSLTRFPTRPLQGKAASGQAQAFFMRDLWRDACGFAGAVMVRRLVGIAHVADMDSIAGAWRQPGALLLSPEPCCNMPCCNPQAGPPPD